MPRAVRARAIFALGLVGLIAWNAPPAAASECRPDTGGGLLALHGLLPPEASFWRPLLVLDPCGVAAIMPYAETLLGFEVDFTIGPSGTVGGADEGGGLAGASDG